MVVKCASGLWRIIVWEVGFVKVSVSPGSGLTAQFQ